MPYSYPINLRVLYSAQYHRQHYTLQAFEQFEALCMHNLMTTSKSDPAEIQIQNIRFEPHEGKTLIVHNLKFLIILKSVIGILLDVAHSCQALGA